MLRDEWNKPRLLPIIAIVVIFILRLDTGCNQNKKKAQQIIC